MDPIVSIIIPCYNSESTLEETLASLLVQSFYDWEAILVNDGSPDNLEEIALKWMETDKRFQYYKKKNGGLGSARNYGIQKAKGRYILPLDSDNKVRPDFAKRAIDILEKESAIGVVYGDAMYFGEKEGLWKVGEFDLHKMLRHNYIDACAIIRKSVLERVGNYSTKMPYQGHEDWDLWLSLVQTGFKFHYLNSITFDYRVSNASMINRFTDDMVQKNMLFLKKKHFKLYAKALLFKRNRYGDFVFWNRIRKIFLKK